MVAILGDKDEQCGGSFPWRGQTSFLGGCAVGGLAPLIGRAIPATSRVVLEGIPIDYPGIGMAVKVGPPGHGGCWVVLSLVVRYHVGIRHYTATTGEDFAACRTGREENAADTAIGQPSAG